MARRRYPVKKRELTKVNDLKRPNLNVDLIIDTRETIPWDFSKMKMPRYFNIQNIYYDKLDYGDYSIVGYDVPSSVSGEFGIIVERKRTMEEFIGNILSDTNWNRFKRVAEGMSNYRHKTIIIEDDLRDAYKRYRDRKGPSKYFSVPPEFISSRIGELRTRWGIDVFFASDLYLAKRHALDIFKFGVWEDMKHDCY